MSGRALVFGSAAEAYEQHRLGYPDVVADLTLTYAHAPVVRALEVGAGTGKGTRLFADRGLAVAALEPDPAMATVLRRTTTGLPVEVVVSTFEAYATEGRAYDLLFCAQAWHWMEPATRLDAASALLRSGGTVALFGTVGAGSRLADPALREQVGRLEDTVLPLGRLTTNARSPSGLWWPGSDLDVDPRFTDVAEHDVSRSVLCTREDQISLRRTLSPYLRLPPGERDRLLARVGAALPDEVEVDATVRLHLARRV